MNKVKARLRLSVRYSVAASLLCGLGWSASLAAAPPPTAVAEASAISADALRSAVSDDVTRQFYEQNGWQPVWSSSARQALEQALASRSRHGLDHVVFLKDKSGSSSPAAQEVAMTSAALHYARALAYGHVDPKSLHQIYTLPQPQIDLTAALAKAIAQTGLGNWLEGLAPRGADYAALSEAYRMAEKAMQGSGDDGSPIAASGVIHVGDSDKRVPAIVQQLRSHDYLSGSDVSASSERYTQPISDALKKLQRDYGIADDGVAGPDTVEVLNLRPVDRARAIGVALERLRWLERAAPTTRIDVNIAAARLRYYRDGNMVDSRKVIVGKPGRETPLLMSPIYRLVANPTWTIPKSIEKSEMAHVSAAYLSSRNMVRRNGYIVQQHGPDNALGLVKFDMKNNQAIYLHDTSAPSLFDRSERHLSHGCIRVDDALEFAQMLADDQGISGKWDSAHAASKQTFVDLPNEIPVRLLYQNVRVDDAGQIVVGTDPYGWNGPVAKALGFGEGSAARARAEKIDVGP